MTANDQRMFHVKHPLNQQRPDLDAKAGLGYRIGARRLSPEKVPESRQ